MNYLVTKLNLLINLLFVVNCLVLGQTVFKVEPYTTGAYNLGEGPHWDSNTQSLYFVDAFVGNVLHLDHRTGHLDKYSLKDLVTIVIPYELSSSGTSSYATNKTGTDLLVSLRNKVVKYNTGSKSWTPVAEIAPELNGKERFNDGKCDAKGRLWIGSVLDGPSGAVPGAGSLYKLQHGQFIKMSTGFHLSNGMVWSTDNKLMYFIDSEGSKIYVFDFDLETGSVTNRRVFLDTKISPDFRDNEVPDGMTIDSTGRLWVGVYNGGRVVQLNPQTGKVEQTIQIPDPITTTPIFGGSGLNEMFVTTGNGNQNMTKYPDAGKLFSVTTSSDTFRSARNTPSFNSDI